MDTVLESHEALLSGDEFGPKYVLDVYEGCSGRPKYEIRGVGPVSRVWDAGVFIKINDPRRFVVLDW